MPARVFYLVAYDIRDPGRLAKVLEVVKAWSTGGQKSVHECWLDARELDALERELLAVIDARFDSLVIIRPDSPKAVRTLGIATRPRDEAWMLFD
jgi:CRISPR-associated protein Cas2